MSSSVLQFRIPEYIFFSAFKPKIIKFLVKLNISYMVISFTFHDLWQL